jgi:hypothetical protein
MASFIGLLRKTCPTLSNRVRLKARSSASIGETSPL